MAPPGWFRLLRAGGFAAVCVVLSKAGHDLMASRPAPVWTAWAALAGVGALGYRLADRRRPLWWILLAVQVVQLCLHVWFTCGTPHVAPPSPAMVMDGAMHHVAGVPMAHGSGMPAGMVVVHLFAGVLVAVWLHAGERALWRALGLIVATLFGSALGAFTGSWCEGSPADRCPAGRLGRTAGNQTRPSTATLRHALVRRGPPPSAASGFSSVRDHVRLHPV